MLHLIYVLAVMFVAPALCSFIEHRVNKDRPLLWVLCKWFVFWTIGIRSVTAALMQIFNPAYTAALLQLDVSHYMAIQELGFAQLGIGVLGVLSLPFSGFRKSAAVSAGVFLFGAAVLHIMRLTVVDFDEAVSLLGDVFVVVIALVCVLSRKALSVNVEHGLREKIMRP